MNTHNLNLSPEISAQQKRKKALFRLAGIVLISGLIAGAYHMLFGAHTVSTDNAYTAAEIAQVAAATSGTIAEIRARDTQVVRQGEVLVVLDPADARLKLAETEAELNRAIRRVKAYSANDGSLAAQIAARSADEKKASAQVASAESDLERAKIDLSRRQALLNSGSVSGEELSKANNAYANAEANLAASKAVELQAQSNRTAALGAREANAVLIAGVDEASNPEVALARARRDQARLDLDRTVIVSPVAGVVVKRQVQLGQRIAMGTPLMSVVPVGDIHVDANFKENQLQNVRIGQTATLKADVYGDAVTYHGVVEGFSGGSGSAFAAIPAQNATGNWIKVVQRVPVRIRLNTEELQKHPLKVGLSMSADIDTRSSVH